jgi:PAS domain S-box-containing protein
LEKAWTGLRDSFSARVLGTTSDAAPRLDGGLSRPARIAISVVTSAFAGVVAWLVGGLLGLLFVFPALMIVGLFGGGVLSAVALVGAVFAASRLLAGEPFWIFVTAAAVQTLGALLLRLLFRESRRWGVRYRRLLNAMSSAVTVSDDQGRIERPHPELGRLIGMAWPDYAGARWLGAIHPEDRAKLVPQGPYRAVALQRAEIRLKEPHTGDWRWHLMRAVPLLDERDEVAEWISILTDVHERKLSREQQDLVVGEARHRLKNLMTIIDSLVMSSRPRGPLDPAVEEFQKRIVGRLHALSTASDLALAGNYTTMHAREVVEATLAPFLETDSARITVGGPDLVLNQATGGNLALGVHELATNAIKHGALRVPGGRVSFTWNATPAQGGRRVEMVWRESGGPPPVKPERAGYGTRVIAFIASRERNGSVAMEYPPEGYVCRIAFLLPGDPVAAQSE